jgi:hypothetical protein
MCCYGPCLPYVEAQSGYSTVLEKAEVSVTGAIKIGQGHQAQSGVGLRDLTEKKG